MNGRKSRTPTRLGADVHQHGAAAAVTSPGQYVNGRGAHPAAETTVVGIASAMEALAAFDLPDSKLGKPVPCFQCGAVTRIARIAYEYDYRGGESAYLTFTKMLPGYRCTNDTCQSEYRDTAANELFLGIVGSTLAKLGDSELQSELELQRTDPMTYGQSTTLPSAVTEQLHTHAH